jgi:hypothetical protein
LGVSHWCFNWIFHIDLVEEILEEKFTVQMMDRNC